MNLSLKKEQIVKILLFTSLHFSFLCVRSGLLVAIFTYLSVYPYKCYITYKPPDDINLYNISMTCKIRDY